MLKGMERLNDVVSEFVKLFDCSCSFGTDFSCNTNRNHIDYTVVVAETHSQSFMDRVERLYPDVKADEFLWGLLHEIGHIETIDDFDDDEIAEFHLIKDVPNISDEEYYEVPDEFEATDWAANFMRENATLVNSFWAKVQPEIQSFYKINGII